MLNIEITAATVDLGCAIAARLETAGHKVTRIAVGGTRCAVRYRRGLEVRSLLEIIEGLQPFTVASSTEADLDKGVDLSIELGAPEPLQKWKVRLHVDSEPFGAEMHRTLQNAGFRVTAVNYCFQSDDTVHYGGASDYALRYLSWVLDRKQIQAVESKEFEDSDCDLVVMLRSPDHRGKLPREYLDVTLQADDGDAVSPLARELERLGYRVKVEAAGAMSPTFQFRPGPFSQSGKDGEDLYNVTMGFLNSLGVDQGRHPLESVRTYTHRLHASMVRTRQVDPSLGLSASITLPIRAWREGAIKPYAGAIPERYPVLLRTDDPDRVAPLVTAIRSAGFPVALRSETDILCPSVQIAGAPSEVEQISQTVTGLLDQTGLSAAWPKGMLQPVQGHPEPCAVTLALPFSFRPGSTLESGLESLCRKVDVWVHYTRSADCSPIVNRLRPMAFNSLKADSVPILDSFRIRYGGADPAVIAAIARELHSLTGTPPSVCNEWDDADMDVFIDVPSTIAAALSETAMPATQVLEPIVEVRSRTGFLRRGKSSVRVGDLKVPLRLGDSALVPTAEELAGYCLDQPTAETLRHLALSVLLREPCLLEGPTGTSKTSSIRYLAWQLNMPVVRINLNGQTDTGELVGRFVPRAVSAGGSSPWMWQDGLLVQAMRRGWWVILDEVNLAEPQILERLNSVLEDTPSLTLTEFDNSVLGAGGEPIHEDFRLFATMNPADYAGRSVLSPAWRDRWRATRVVPAAREAEYAALLRQSVTGIAPLLTIGGISYHQPRAVAPFASLRKLRGIEAMIDGLARFHAAVERAAGGVHGTSPHLGPGRKEPYVFTRRGVLSVLRYVEHLASTGAKGTARELLNLAVSRYYIARCNTREDRGAMEKLLEASLGQSADQEPGPDTDLGEGPPEEGDFA